MTVPDLPYRPCVGIMLLNRGGRVFVGKRLDQTVEGWQMPQGGIDAGENPRAAALRELREETGTDKAEIIGEMADWITYDLPPHLIGVAFHGRYKGQRQKWFCLRFLGQDRDIDLHAHEPEFSEWKWVEVDALPGLIVPFKRDIYRKVIEGFRALASSPAADAANQTKPADAANQTKPADAANQTKPADAANQTKPADAANQKKP